MRPPNARSIADQYVRMMAYSYEAKKEGLDKDPQFQQQLQEVEMQLLANVLQKKLKDETANPPEQAIEEYYNKNIKQYDEVIVRSVQIPRPPQSKAAAQTAASAEGAAPWPEGEDVATQQIANQSRQQLIAGEDPDKVQKAAYAAAKCTEPLPSTQPIVWRRNVSFPAPEEAMLFALKPGEVSLPVPNGHGLTIYKLESRRTIPLAEVRVQLKALYQMEQIQERLNAFLENAHPVLNEKYFNTETEAELKARDMERAQEEQAERQ
ncbi:MAG TPA: peptidylprolyl isomerase [Candidatus Acidoferrum sp.]|nr:peptidylprolyl isomerase [Candidatus Acidoferrum sp.]